MRLRSELDKGALMDLGCYCVSASRLLAGEPAAAAGVRVLGDGGVDEGPRGRCASPTGSSPASTRALSPPASHLQVAGDAGTLTVEDPWHIRAPGTELVDARGTRRIEVPSADSDRLKAGRRGRRRTAVAALTHRRRRAGAAIAALYAAATCPAASVRQSRDGRSPTT